MTQIQKTKNLVDLKEAVTNLTKHCLSRTYCHDVEIGLWRGVLLAAERIEVKPEEIAQIKKEAALHIKQLADKEILSPKMRKLGIELVATHRAEEKRTRFIDSICAQYRGSNVEVKLANLEHSNNNLHLLVESKLVGVFVETSQGLTFKKL